MTIKSPVEGVFYTVEISRAGGLASNTTRVYAHFQRYEKTKKVLILEGDDITVSRIVWNGPHDATLCLNGGFTNTFRNEVTLIVGDAPEDSFAIHNRIDEHCGTTSTIAPNAGN
jgi:hypothetical protein